MVSEQLERIKKEKESQLESRINHAFEAQRLLELSRAKVEADERYKTELSRIKTEFETQLLHRSKELRLAREHEEESIKIIEEELEKRLKMLKNKEPQPSIEELRDSSNAEVGKHFAKAKKLLEISRKLKKEIQIEKENYRNTMQKLTELRQEFASLKVG
ncbi:hypothetical protein GPJ56_008351 [Histomonas meleagridis]|uniref:uncharacterized protein n=1 Tax=Histomonas meleagridis TaxID=135588 RepID=UPI00355ABE49|nr:hypothetical protein GPJ56_008351 [Histomonas meleagridis]KAH0798887.1 hypothetical protein GO595_008278 [Histomonas meleagridis]